MKFGYLTICLLTIWKLEYVICDKLESTPIIGVLTQEVSRLIERQYPGQYSSYIAASYVKFVEGAGGRVVPIWIGQPASYYADLLTKINGVLLPGGATFFNQSDGYADAGKYIFEIASKLNDEGTYFPLWGTCLGFELLVYLSGNGTDPRTECYSQSQALPLEFVDGFNSSRLFAELDNGLKDIFMQNPITANFHMYCFTVQTFKEMGLDSSWQILSLNHDWNEDEFISIVEHKKYPFYGVQFHPEKNLYEFVRNKNITHNKNSTKTSQYFANFLINEARKNNQKFENYTEEKLLLIYNYNPIYTGASGSAFVQQYLFPSHRNFAISLSLKTLTIAYFILSNILL